MKLKHSIICDLQERPSKLPRRFEKAGFKVKLKKLPVGDYWYEWLVIERKAVYQLLTDMFSRQLDKQIANMIAFCAKHNKTPCMVVEFGGKVNKNVEMKQQMIAEKHLRTLAKDLWIIQTYNTHGGPTSTLDTITYYAEKIDKNRMVQTIRRPEVVRGSKVDAIAVLTGFTGIDTGRAKLILNSFGSLDKAFRNIQKWSKRVDGIGPKTQINVLARFKESKVEW